MTPTAKATQLGAEEFSDSHAVGYKNARFQFWAKGFPSPETAKVFVLWLDKHKIRHSDYHRATGNNCFELDKVGWNE